jgi:hypothetical protein
MDTLSDRVFSESVKAKVRLIELDGRRQRAALEKAQYDQEQEVAGRFLAYLKNWTGDGLQCFREMAKILATKGSATRLPTVAEQHLCAAAEDGLHPGNQRIEQGRARIAQFLAAACDPKIADNDLTNAIAITAAEIWATGYRNADKTHVSLLAEEGDDVLRECGIRYVRPTAKGSKPATKTRTNCGGRPRKWDKLWAVIQEQDGKVPKPKDAKIAAVYNQQYGISTGSPKRATVDIVRQVRYARRKQNPK